MDTSHEPDVVQCLKFYSCGSIARLIDYTPKKIEQANKGGPVEIDDVVMAQRIRDASKNMQNEPLSPGGPKFEIVLDEKSHLSDLDSIVVASKENKDDDTSSLEELSEAPDFDIISNAPSMVLEITGLTLRLDDDSEADIPKEEESRRRRTKGGPRQGNMSVTSIEIPAIQPSDEADKSSDRYKMRGSSPLTNSESGKISDDEISTDVENRERQQQHQKRKRWFPLRTKPATAPYGKKLNSVSSSSSDITAKQKKNKRSSQSFFRRLRTTKASI